MLEEIQTNWANIINFHKDIVRHAQDSFYKLTGDGTSGNRFSAFKDYELENIEGPWEINSDSFENETFKKIIEADEEHIELILGLFAFRLYNNWSPLLIREVRVEIDEDGLWRIIPNQGVWDVSPSFLDYLNRNEIASSQDIDTKIEEILERTVRRSKALEQSILKTLYEELILEFPFLQELFKREMCDLVLFNTPEGVSVYDKHLMSDFEELLVRLQNHQHDIGGLKLLDGYILSGKNEKDTANTHEIFPIVSLNESQKSAVEGILREKPITVISGPPGCGKSQVVVATLFNCWAQGKSVLFVSQNNKAVDVVSERFSNLAKRVPILVRAGSSRNNKVQSTLSEISNLCMGIANLSFSNGQNINIRKDYQKLQIERESLQNFLDSKLPLKVDESYRAALQAHGKSLGVLAEIDQRYKYHQEILLKFNVKLPPEQVFEKVIKPFERWIEEIQIHEQEIETERENIQYLTYKLDDNINQRNYYFENYGIDSTEICEWDNKIEETMMEKFQSKLNQLRKENKTTIEESLQPYLWKTEYDSWKSENQILQWIEFVNSWINGVKIMIADTSSQNSKLKEYKEKSKEYEKLLSEYYIDPNMYIPIEIIKSWLSVYGEIITTPKNWRNKLPFSHYNRLMKKLNGYEENLRKFLPLELITRLGTFDENGRMILAKILSIINKWMMFKNTFKDIEKIEEEMERKFSYLKNPKIFEYVNVIYPSIFEHDKWMDVVNQINEHKEIAIEASEVWRKRKQYLDSIERIKGYEVEFNKIILNSNILNQWHLEEMQELVNTLGRLAKEPELEKLHFLYNLILNKKYDVYINDWKNVVYIQNEIQSIIDAKEKIPKDGWHMKEWWKNKPNNLSLGNAQPMSFPKEDGPIYELYYSMKGWYQKWKEFWEVEKLELYNRAFNEHTYALDKLKQAFELVPKELHDEKIKKLLSDDEMTKLGSPWAQEKMDDILYCFSPQYVKGKLYAIDNKIQSMAIKVAEQEWLNKTSQKTYLINKLRDYGKKFMNGTLREEEFREMLEVVPIWVTTSQSTKGIPLAPNSFEVLIIDEASQCTLTNLIPLIYRAKRLVVIGDKEQLPAIPNIGAKTENALAKKYFLDEDTIIRLGHCNNDVFETAARSLPGGITEIYNLNEHYRSVPQIIVFSNRYIYNKRLVLRREMSEEDIYDSDGTSGVFKVNIQGVAYQGNGKRSWMNISEVNKVVELIKFLKNDPKMVGCNFGVVTPFKAQSQKIEECLAKENLLHDVTVGTAHKFQGDERDVMILSTVIAKNMQRSTINWVQTPHNLINVAVTRARNALYIVGDFETMRRQNGILRKLAEYVDDMDKVRQASHAEVILLTLMGMEGWNPKVHPIIGGSEVDFVLEYEGVQLAIEVDGRQHIKQELTDASRDAMLRGKGYKVLRVPARDVIETPNVVIDYIRNMVVK